MTMAMVDPHESDEVANGFHSVLGVRETPFGSRTCAAVLLRGDSPRRLPRSIGAGIR